MSRLPPPTPKQIARSEELQKLMEASTARFNALPAIEQAIEILQQRRSFVRGNISLDTDRTSAEVDADIMKQPEYVVLQGFLDARAEIARLRAERDGMKERCAEVADKWANEACGSIDSPADRIRAMPNRTTSDTALREGTKEMCLQAIALLRDQADTEWGKENNGRSEGAAYNRVVAYVRAMEAIRALPDQPASEETRR